MASRTRAIGAALVAALLPAGAGATTIPLRLANARVAGEDLAPLPPDPEPITWVVAQAGSGEWTPGAGVLRLARDAALHLTVADSGGELVSPDLAVSASRFGRLRLAFSDPPKLAEPKAGVTWTRDDGTTETVSIPVSLSTDAGGKSWAELRMESDLYWYGGIRRIAVRFPRTVDGSPISIESIRLEPRQAPYTSRTRVKVEDFELAVGLSPFQARHGLFLPPDSRYELVSDPAVAADVRFGLAILGRRGRFATGSFDGDYTTVLEVSITEVLDGRELARKRIPIAVQSSRWLDYTIPIPAGGSRPLRVVFSYRDAHKQALVIVSKPRLRPRGQARTTLLTTLDALRKSHVSIYGYARPTRAIDRVAREGVVFTRAYSQANNTSTSILSLMTSQYPGNAPWDGPRPDRPSLARLLSDQGVYTVMVVSNPILQEPYLSDGFDEIVYVYAHGWHTSEDVEAQMARVLQIHKEEDLFLFTHFIDPHAPYTPPLHTQGAYAKPSNEQAALIGASVDPWVYREAYLEPGLNTPPIVPVEALTREAIQRAIDRYDEELLDVDLHLGNVWKRLKALGLYDRALLVVTTDHGEEFYEHRGVQHGSLGLYEEVTGVPLVVKLPRGSPLRKLRRGRRVDTIVQLLDLYPTIVEVMGHTPPPWTVGENIFRVQRGYAISEWVLTPGRRRRAITNGEHKLIEGEQVAGDTTRPDPPLLFRLSDDPGERTNLAEQQPDVVVAMRRRMEETLRAAQSP